MTNNRLQNFEENPPVTKRKKVLAAVAQEIVTSEDDDTVLDANDVCDIIENHSAQHKKTPTSIALYALGQTIKNTLLEINEIRERNRERRHRELLEILTKMTQHDGNAKIESPKKSNPNYIEQDEVSKERLNIGQYIFEETKVDSLDKKQSDLKNSIATVTASNSSSSIKKEVNPSPNVKSSESTLKIVPIQLLSSSTAITSPTAVNNQSLGNVKLVIAGKQDATEKLQEKNVENLVLQRKKIEGRESKEELQKMRAEMLELQRKKMEDRERKKRQLIQLKNT